MATVTIKQCKSCRSLIASNAIECPECGSDLKNPRGYSNLVIGGLASEKSKNVCEDENKMKEDEWEIDTISIPMWNNKKKTISFTVNKSTQKLIPCSRCKGKGFVAAEKKHFFSSNKEDCPECGGCGQELVEKM